MSAHISLLAPTADGVIHYAFLIRLLVLVFVAMLLVLTVQLG